ncbi:MAG: UDP-N-acetylmuramoyl-tripeptide--D-alanyl-D-alanine ligase [Terrimicrobiaceae bacterium]|jgi:UDP-N-acetylmuramoyl-tripeptide--D-alanyl-D-alanine ligase|nr:UDP-N-acetylmuramoyl-tripeptide--D-alanyl-D-alanine ligase [Terrimicrobiaceae bacterium]
MDLLSLEEIAEMSGAKILRGDGQARVSRISKDTRTLRPGDLYVALRGDAFDGNLFSAEAVARGAAAVLVDNEPAASALPKEFPVLLAGSGLDALTRLASAWRARLKLKALCITGSNGKTSTKEFAAAVLSTRFQVAKTEGNFNNHIGVPLSILSAGTADTAAVWEIGMNHPGEIAPLAALAKPDAAIITNIGITHIEYLKTREAIALEKSALAEAVPQEGFVILPAEDDRSDFIASRAKARVVRVGLTSGSLTASSLIESLEGCSFVVHAGGRSFGTSIPCNGAHMVRNALLAVAAGIEFGISPEDAVAALPQTRLAGGRLQHRIIRGISFLDDTYNANPDSMEAALTTLRALPGSGRRIAVLGRMGELGSHELEGYRRTGIAAGKNVDILITVGAESAPMADAARETGLGRIHEVEDTASAALMLVNLARPGDIVLVKGSRSARMESVLKHFEQ